MTFTFEEAVEYAAAHSTPATAVLRRLGEETEKTQDVPQMSVGGSKEHSSGSSSR